MLKVWREFRRTVKWLLVGALVAQLVIVPWDGDFYRLAYGTIFVRPGGGGGGMVMWTIAHERLLAQLAVTVAVLLLWLAVSKAKE